ncbi:MAG: hypothetical protein LJF04_13175 [Gemmatimonadetes bacterium]|nr:hypothetical protein [Gemmatimonadota bacterium]
MSRPDPTSPPSWRTIAPTQLRMLAQLQKKDFVILGSIVAVLVALSIWGIAHASPDNGSNEPAMIFAILTIPLVIVAAFWPLGVWRKESPEQRGYFWSLPASRGPHTLLRVGAGWAILMIVCVAIMVVTWVLAEASQVRFGPLEISLARWYVPFATATLAYVLISFLAVLLDGPVRALVWTCVAVGGLRIVAEATQLTALGAPIDTVVTSLGMALAGPLGSAGPEVVLNGSALTQGFVLWGANYLIWIVLGLVALVLAAFRHQDAR